jgi:hypothetical protein
MAYDPETVISRDGTCRLRFPGCTRHASRVLLDVPEFLGGACSDTNALAACGHCWGTQQQQRARAADLFGYAA